MLRNTRITTILLTILTMAAMPSTSISATLTGKDLIIKAMNVYGGDDSVAHVEYQTTHPNSSAVDKMSLIRVWKPFRKDGIYSKVMSFSTYPPSSVGVATLVVAYEFSEKKRPDTWVYIPVLRKVKYLPPPKDESINPGEDDPNYAPSVMKIRELAPRDPEMDNHKLLGQKTKNGVTYYVVESTPKNTQFDKYSKTRSWIRKDNFLRTKVEYYVAGKKSLIQHFQWKKIGKAWTWEKVIGKRRDGTTTTITVSDVKINTGLKDSIFDQRTLKRGWK